MELTPKTRKETFLAAAGGQDVTTPTPITREEVFLDEIAKGGGGSSLPSTETASAGDVLSLDDNKEPQWATPSGGGGVVLVVTDTEGTLNKTFKEINDASNSGWFIIVLYNGSYWYQGTPIDTENLYMSFRQLSLNQIGSTYYMPTREYVAKSVNDYPVLDV